MAGRNASPATVFVRQATGLVRAWSMFDAFIYAFFSVNLITLGLYIISQMYFLEGALIPAILISTAFILFECIVYAGLIAVMPRAGGDYVWQTRILGPGIGFVLAVTGWWFILWLWVPLYGDMLRQMFFTPVLGILGARDLALWFIQTPEGLFISSVIVCLVVSVYVGLGMRRYAQIQKVSFFISLLGLAVVFLLLLVNSAETFRQALEREATAMFGAAGPVYEGMLRAGEEAGAVLPLASSPLWPIFLAIPYVVFFNLWPNWGATLYGEVRGASDFKRNFYSMAGALVITAILAVLFMLLIAKTFTWDFFVKANGAWWNYAWGYTDTPPPLPIWPYPALLAAFMVPNRLVQLLIVLAMSAWWFGWSGTVFLSSTRVIFAAAFDRLLPERVADVDPRTHTPYVALMLMVIPSLVISALFAWDVGGFQTLTLDATLVIAVTYLGSTIAAILLPYRKPDLYNASPIAKYKVAGVPLITVAGIIFGAFLVFLLYLWLFDPYQLYGIGLANTSSVIFMGFLYLLALVIYLGFRTYRMRQGIPIDRIYAEIPVE